MASSGYGVCMQLLHCHAHSGLKPWSCLQPFPPNQRLAKLPWLVCRMRQQEVAWAALAKDGEWWGEPLVRHLRPFCKKISK